MGAPVDAVPTLRINTQSAHPVELADGSHHRSWVSLRFGLASRLQQGLNAPGQHLLPVEVWAFDVVMDLTPCPLDELVALRSGDPPCLSRILETSGVGLPRQDHSLEVFDSLRCLCCSGSRHNRSTRESRWHSELFGQLNDRTIWSTFWSTPR